MEFQTLRHGEGNCKLRPNICVFEHPCEIIGNNMERIIILSAGVIRNDCELVMKGLEKLPGQIEYVMRYSQTNTEVETNPGTGTFGQKPC